MERRVIREFIEIYRSEPSLWKVRSSHYNNKAIKNAAYRRMVSKLSEFYPNADTEMVKRKINALRTNYRKELRKVEASKTRNQLTGEPVYVPSLWYYNLFYFIGDQEQENDDPSMCFDIIETHTVDTRNAMTIDIDCDESGQYDVEDMSDELEEEFQAYSPDESVRNTKENHQRITPYQRSHPPLKRLCNSNSSDGQSSLKPDTDTQDSEDVFGRYVAFKLRGMDHSSRLLSERLISEVLYRGQMRLLTGKTSLSSDEAHCLHTTIKVEE